MRVYYARKDMESYFEWERTMGFDCGIQPYETKMPIKANNFKWMILKIRIMFKNTGIIPCSDFIEGATPEENERYGIELSLLEHTSVMISERRILAPSMN